VPAVGSKVLVMEQGSSLLVLGTGGAYLPLTGGILSGALVVDGLTTIKDAGVGIVYNHAYSGGTANRIGFKWASPNIVGNIDASGNVVVGTVSDRRLKADVEPLDGGLALVERLRPVTFAPLDLDGSRVRGAPRHVGLVADEVAQVVPSAVSMPETDSGGGFASLNHAELVPVLIRAVQELSARVTELEGER
jgi:hypothetical protein